MQKSLTYITYSGILILSCFFARAQEKPTIKTTVDRNQILIGEPIRLSIDVKSPMVSGNELPQFDSLAHFEMIEKANRDSVISAEGVSYHLEWKITSFDSGTHYIPSFPVLVDRQIYKTDSLPIEVSYGKVDTAKDYHDIKNIIDVPNPDMKYIPWAVSVVCLLSLLAFIWFMRRQPVRKVEELETKISSRKTPVEEALYCLEQLKTLLREDPPAVKKYYSGMNDILRVFLNRQLGLVTMEKTSEELIHSLSTQNMERGVFTKLSAALRMGDFVKFAKYVPGPFENEENMETIKSAIIFFDEKD